jgi:hypothetical protein
VVYSRLGWGILAVCGRFDVIWRDSGCLKYLVALLFV